MTTTTPTTLPLLAGAWELDPAHSSVSFAIRHLGVSKVRGRFTGFTTDVVVGADLEGTSVTAVVDLATVDTANTDRDAHVRADDLLDVANRPTMTFRSTAIRPDGDEWTLEGDLTIGDITKRFSLSVELGGIEVHPADGRRHAGFEANGELRRTDFGIAPQYPAAMLGDVVKVQLDLQLIEPAT
jgi:polyisoprenoid-binding protein YceI